jgi:ABC-type multidrug transport system ATPase subunit
LDKVKARAKTLSGGQKRKLQLAISFTGGSSVCFIDEASSGLDPLSRRNIWNIIQNGHSKRTVLITTHFLDEADVLADHIAIVYKGNLVCAGPPTSLKTRYGGEYIIRSEPSGNDDNYDDGDDDNMVWRASTSSEAARKVLELETLTDDHLLVNFPTLEKVFLNVTDSTTAINESSGDGVAGEDTVMDEKAFAIETANARDLDLEVGRGISLVRQIFTLFQKRYTLLLSKAGWISYGINLIIPIIIGGVLAHYVPKLPSLQTCADNVNILHNLGLVDQQGSKFAPLYYSMPEYLGSGYGPTVLLGPNSALSGNLQDEIYVSDMGPYILGENAVYSGNGLEPELNTTTILNTRKFVDSTSAMVASIKNSSLYSSIEVGIWAPNQDSAILYHAADDGQLSRPMYGLSYITNRMANATNPRSRKSIANLQFMAHVESNVSFWSMPISLFIVIAFIAAAYIAGIYPNYEKLNNVRMLEYCNGVSPLALWTANILFDMQFGLLQSHIVWGITFAGSLERLYYEGTNVLGALILFTLATYLGTYVLSLFVKKAAFAIAAGVHLLLFILYLVGYIVNQATGNIATRHQTYSILQYALGLTSPAANLARALWLSMNVFEVLCGEYGSDESPASSYKKYGSVYANFIIQIIFLISILGIYEYGSADWFRRHVTHRGVPARLHYLVDSGEIQDEKRARIANPTDPSKILSVSRLTKFFGKNFAVQNISFDIAKGSTLALLGANGAGKTTTINLIRGDMKPDFGDITLDGISVLRQPHKARLHMGVCPQNDAVDNLTVRQTLSFYASVKGLKNVSGNVDKVLNALNIASFEHVMVKALSGGTKRKLSVAIALIGNPRVLLLDEPSTGQDAGAKRILWKTLKEIRGNRAILLTTHSMEEAESLATNVAIMGTRMLATGTLTSLQEQYGALYTIRAIRVPGMTESDAQEIVKYLFENRVVDYQDRHGQVIFNLPHNRSNLGKILKTMEALKGERIEANGAAEAGRSSDDIKVFLDYTLTPPTLEEVFMQVSKEAGNNVGGA